jgi:hypothetical protein
VAHRARDLVAARAAQLGAMAPPVTGNVTAH